MSNPKIDKIIKHIQQDRVDEQHASALANAQKVLGTSLCSRLGISDDSFQLVEANEMRWSVDIGGVSFIVYGFAGFEYILFESNEVGAITIRNPIELEAVLIEVSSGIYTERKVEEKIVSE